MHIGSITAQSDGNGSRVVAEVDGVPLWFASKDVELKPAAEAYASALLIPALSAGQDLELEDPLDPMWIESVPKLCALLSDWWGYSPRTVIAPLGSVVEVTPRAGQAQCFSGGVDSFFSLLSAEKAPEALVYVQGYDIPLDDTPRLDAFELSLREVARETGSRAVVVASNFRHHPSTQHVNWGRSHGGALACVGHLLSGVVGSLLIPASYPRHYDIPWGSRWDLDPLWSSSRFAVEHDSVGFGRIGKLPSIGQHPLVETHLRVCWENRSPTGNCSRCEKCIRTMLALELSGGLAGSSAFDLSLSVPRLLDSIGAVDHELVLIYEDMRPLATDPELAGAVDRLVARSRSRWKGPILRYFDHRRAQAVKPHWRPQV